MSVDNSKQARRLTKNTAYLTGALMFQKLLTLVYYTFLARSIGDERIGAYSFALVFVGIFGIFIDFGLGPILTREVSRNKEKAQKYFSNILTTKLLFTVFSLIALFAVFALRVHYKDISIEKQHMVYLASAVIVFDSFTFTFYSLFRAWQRIRYEALGVVLYQLVIVSLGFLCIYSNKATIYFVAVVLSGSIFHFIYSLTLLLRRSDIRLKLGFDFTFSKKIFLMAAPFAFAGIFFKLNGSLDQTMLEFFSGDRYVGWYTTAFKLAFALTVLPGAFATSFFPVMSRYYKKDMDALRQVFERAMVYLMIISLPIAAGILVAGKEIVVTLYEEPFSPAGDALYIFAFGIVFIFLNYPVGNLLNACRKQLRNTVHMGIALGVNVVLNLVLIPRDDRFGTYIGASIAAVISSMVLIFLGLYVARKIVNFNVRFLFGKFFRILLASSAMALILILLKPYIPLLGIIAIAPFLYIAFIFFVRAMSFAETKQLIRSVIRK